MSDPTRTGAWANIEESVGGVNAIVPAVATGSDGFSLLGRARYAGKVTEVRYYPNAALTGDSTNTRRIRIYNRTSGGGTTLIADLQFNTAINLVAKTKKVITLTATLGDRVVAAGDLLEFKSDHVGTGLADPGGICEIDISRTAT